jgi:6-phosphogluconolactonase
MTTPNRSESPARRDFGSRAALADALAADIARSLADSIAARGEASLLVSGGSTPKRLFQELAGHPLDWRAVRVSLVDERWVSPDSQRSNARLVAENLLTGPAEAAEFVPLYTEGMSAADGVAPAIERAGRLCRPFDAVILGMGTDGHTASFFPGADRLDAALDPANASPLIAIEAPGAGEPRLTFTLPSLLDTRLLALHVEGAQKAEALERALAPGPVAEMPVRAVLRQATTPLTIYWCP